MCSRERWVEVTHLEGVQQRQGQPDRTKQPQSFGPGKFFCGSFVNQILTRPSRWHILSREIGLDMKLNTV